jgi:hypothetical protein
MRMLEVKREPGGGAVYWELTWFTLGGRQRRTLTVRGKRLAPEERPEFEEGDGQPLLAPLTQFAPVPQHG